MGCCLEKVVKEKYDNNSSKRTYQQLKEYIIKGFAMDDERLKEARTHYFEGKDVIKRTLGKFPICRCPMLCQPDKKQL